MVSNRLAGSQSPYLRAHADDPVDWHPWSSEALAESRTTGKPVFLSVGYASCHWCHVMHRESFQDPATAALLNEHFVSIKVDREVRPDIEELYMGYVVAANGRGGWPMSVVLTPELAPVFGGTYFPPEPRHGMSSFRDVMGEVAKAFAEDPEGTEQAARSALDYLRVMFAPPTPGAVTPDVVDRAAETILATADPVHGGFGDAPKFPQHAVASFLLRYHQRTREPRSLAAVESELEGIVRGGIFDQVGGGIARYAVDAQWLVPHFEKMLYDNAQLLTTLATLHDLAPRDEWARAMRATAAFLDRDLVTNDGLYSSALDADTDGVEGATYVWGWEELAEALSPGELSLARASLAVSPEGNWEGANILTRRSEPSPDDTRSEVDALLTKLLAIREQRPQPLLDDKVIVSWNALAARGLLDAGWALGDGALVASGMRVVRALLGGAVRPDGAVRHLVEPSIGLGSPNPSATPAADLDTQAEPLLLEDAAALCVATLRTYELKRDRALLKNARRIFDAARETFSVDETWYMTPEQTELPLRPRERHDGPTPTGTHQMALAAVILADYTGEERYREIAEQTLARAVPLAQRAPLAAGAALEAMVELLASR